jgi:hypothetical protein
MTMYGKRPKTKFMVNLGSDQLDALRKLSAETDVPVASLVRRAIDNYLAVQKDKSFKRWVEA